MRSFTRILGLFEDGLRFLPYPPQSIELGTMEEKKRDLQATELVFCNTSYKSNGRTRTIGSREILKISPHDFWHCQMRTFLKTQVRNQEGLTLFPKLPALDPGLVLRAFRGLGSHVKDNVAFSLLNRPSVKQ